MIGVDIVSVKRIEDIYKKFGEVFLHKIFLEKEIEEINKITNQKRKLEKIAGKFAAKEAVIKALKGTNMQFKNIEIISDEAGIPSCRIEGMKVEISISHERDFAIAVALSESSLLSHKTI